MQRMNVLAIGSLVLSSAGLSCSRDAAVAETPDESMTPASRTDTRATPSDTDDDDEWTPTHDVPPPPPAEPVPAPDTQREPGTLIGPERVPESETGPSPNVPPSELPPSSGPDGSRTESIDRSLNWIDDTGNTIR